MIELWLILLAIALAGLGLAYQQAMLTFISGILFLFIGLESEETFLLIAMLGLAIWQFFSTFFEWRRG